MHRAFVETRLSPLVLARNVFSFDKNFSQFVSTHCERASSSVMMTKGNQFCMPPLTRQDASRFSWPPDSEQSWLYIGLSPTQFVQQAAYSLNQNLSERQVCEFFNKYANVGQAYTAYTARWRKEIDATLAN